MKLVAATIGTLAVTAGPAALPPTGGLYGTVRRGPVTPVCIAGRPCSAPARDTVLRFTTRAGLTTTTRTRADGSYRVRLRAATYRVSVSAGRIAPGLVRVRRARFVRVNFSIDTGIR